MSKLHHFDCGCALDDFWPFLPVTLSSVTLNFELKKVVLSSCLARLLLVPVRFIESEH